MFSACAVPRVRDCRGADRADSYKRMKHERRRNESQQTRSLSALRRRRRWPIDRLSRHTPADCSMQRTGGATTSDQIAFWRVY